MKGKLTFLRTCYWIGIILDARAAILLVRDFVSNKAVQLTNGFIAKDIGTATALMVGWTVLLVWADRKPLERKGIILLTVVPTLLLLFVANIYTVTRGYLSFQENAVNIIGGAVLIMLFSFAYFINRENRYQI